MRRTLKADAFNVIANDPRVRPWLGGTEPLDLSGILADVFSFGFLTDCLQGGYVYRKLADGLYEVHTLSLPEARGEPMRTAATESLARMFTETDALEVVTLVPRPNRLAAIWATRAGFREVFCRKAGFDLNGETVDASYRSLSFNDWVMRDSVNADVGAAFHEMIHRHVPDDHGDDPVHDRWVGATLRCAHSGNIGKAVTMYNRWAAQVGYLPVMLRSLNPIVLDIGTAVLSLRSDGIEVLEVRTARSASSPKEDASCQSPRASPQPGQPSAALH